MVIKAVIILSRVSIKIIKRRAVKIIFETYDNIDII